MLLLLLLLLVGTVAMLLVLRMSAVGAAGAGVVVRSCVLPYAKVADGVVACVAGGVGSTFDALASIAFHAKQRLLVPFVASFAL